MKINILDLINFEEVNKLLEGFNKSTGFVTAILDLEGNVLSKSGWRQICTEFHRINPETSKKCTISDTVLADELGKGEKYHFYKCLNGLVDVAVPILINGEHIANLFSGQFFFHEPDPAFFEKQAKTYGFNKEKYLKALGDVPIVSEEKVKVAMDFLLNMTQLISEITFQKMEQLQLNDSLRKSDERSRSALDHMLEGCQIIGFDWRYIYLNHTAEIHNRRPNDELIGNRYMDMWPGIENTEVFKIITQVMETRVANHFENEFLFPDGGLGWFDLSIQPVPEGVFILSIDITERKHQEEQLFESEFRFNKLYENGPFGMVMADKEFRFKKSNPEFCKIMGYSETELQELTFKDLTHPDDLTRDLLNVKKLMDKEMSVYKTEKRYIRKDGQVIWGSLTVTATYDSEGHFLYNLGIIEDITNRKQTEEELKKSRKLLAETESVGKVGGWEFSIDTLITTWTDEVFRIHEVDLDFYHDVNTGINFYTPSSKPIIEQAVQQAIESGEPFDLELEIITAKGNLRKIHTIGQADPENRRVYGFFQDITERKQVEERLLKSETRFSSLFNQMQEGFALHEIICDSKGKAIDYRFLGINPAFEKLTGLKRSEIIGKTVMEVMPDTEALWIERYGDVALTGNPIEFENYSAPLKRYYQIKSFCPAKNQFAVIFSDISERKRAEEELRERENKLSTILNLLPVGISILDQDQKIVYQNPALENILGITKEGLQRGDHRERKYLRSDGTPKPAEEFASARVFSEKTTQYNIITGIVKEDGTTVWTNVSAVPVEFSDWKVVIVTADITEQKRIDEKIREKDQEFKKLSANVSGLIFQFTRKPDGTYFVPIASEGIRNVFGCSPEDVIDDFAPIGRVIHPDDAERVISDIEYSAANLTYFTCEFRVQIPGREPQWIYSQSTPERLPDGSITWYGFNVDITQLKQAEDVIRKLNETLEQRVIERIAQLEEANKELEAFSYSVSHDLRAPLRHINGFVDMLTADYSNLLPDKAKHYLDVIANSSRDMGTLIDDLLQFSRTGRQEMQESVLDMNKVLQEVLASVELDAVNRKIEWNIAELPQTKADPSLLRMVWFNLLSNAIKFTKDKELAIIQVGFLEEEEENIFFVRDNGAGFDMRYANKLFGVFQRLHSKVQFEGTGIGLANVRRIILKHGGRTWAESKLNEGATFYFTLPKPKNND